MKIRAGRPTAVLAFCLSCCSRVAMETEARFKKASAGDSTLRLGARNPPVIGEGDDGVDFARSLRDTKYGVLRCEGADYNSDEAALSLATER